MNENKMDDQGWIQNKRGATRRTFYFDHSLPVACYVLIEVKCEVNVRMKFELFHVTIDILSSYWYFEFIQRLKELHSIFHYC